VLQRQLALLGYAAEFAENGAIALKWWREGRHALLLTDLHMPEMDGYDLASAIRRESRDATGARFPILALSANALKGEAVRASAAGMDDYLSKPISLKHLQTALNQWMPAPRVAATAATSDAKATPDVAAEAGATGPPAGGVLELQVLRDLIGDDEATVRELLADFLQAAQANAAALREAVNSGDLRRTADVAHKLKSAARSVGALALGLVCAELEAAGREAEELRAKQHLTGFEVAFGATEAAARAHLDSDQVRHG
jgi:CheY-like chemotaxis protein/HPt (histidine-containing phosphotransfer) domain-containing protein